MIMSAATTVTATFNFRRFDDVVCTLNLQVFFAQKRAVKMDHL